MSTLSKIFDKLLDERVVKIDFSAEASPFGAATSLRVSLCRKFSSYKETMDKLGFLEPELLTLGIGMEPLASEVKKIQQEGGSVTEFTFHLRTRFTGARKSYQVLESEITAEVAPSV